MLTIKGDWLNDYLAAQGALVSGHPGFARRLGISGAVALRFIKHRSRVLYFLTINPETTDYEAEYLAAFRAGHLSWLREMFAPLVHLFYSESAAEFCLFKPQTGEFRRVDFTEMTRLVGNYHPDFVKNSGTAKEINKTMNDAFQQWTRQYLSTYLTVNDIDAFAVGGDVPLFFELKRVRESLETWRPYADDNRNYAALEAIAQAHCGVALTLAYQPGGAPAVALHRHLQPLGSASISGQVRLVDAATAVRRPLSVDFSHTPRYTSTNHRQR